MVTNPFRKLKPLELIDKQLDDAYLSLHQHRMLALDHQQQVLNLEDRIKLLKNERIYHTSVASQLPAPNGDLLTDREGTFLAKC